MATINTANQNAYWTAQLEPKVQLWIQGLAQRKEIFNGMENKKKRKWLKGQFANFEDLPMQGLWDFLNWVNDNYPDLMDFIAESNNGND